jgi:hypothetical protein
MSNIRVSPSAPIIRKGLGLYQDLFFVLVKPAV